jgi:Protein of unknown function (DUF3073)
MGRGRAKAKQTKVARQLKYNSGGTDLDRLRAELAGAGGSARPAGVDGGSEETDESLDEDPYESYADLDDDEDLPAGPRG